MEVRPDTSESSDSQTTKFGGFLLPGFVDTYDGIDGRYQAALSATPADYDRLMVKYRQTPTVESAVPPELLDA